MNLVHHLLPTFLLAALALPAMAWADGSNTAPTTGGGQVPPGQQGVDPFFLGHTVPMDTPMTDGDGKATTLRQVATTADGRTMPLVLQVGYFMCPGVCREVRWALAKRLERLPDLKVGRDVAVACVSIDPDEGIEQATFAKDNARMGHEKGVDGWRYLYGPQSSIDAITGSSGFKYAYNPSTRQFMHDAVLIVLTPDGRVADYVDGYGKDADVLRASISKAASGIVAERRILSFSSCISNALSWSARNAIKLMMASGVVTMACLFLFIRRMRRIELARRAEMASADTLAPRFPA